MYVLKGNKHQHNHEMQADARGEKFHSGLDYLAVNFVLTGFKKKSINLVNKAEMVQSKSKPFSVMTHI